MDFARTLQSPEPMADDNSPSDPLPRPSDQGPEQRRGSGQRRPRLSGMTMEQRLQMMPELRPLPWRPGVEMGSELETGGESRRKQIRFGCLLATRGQVQPVPCNTCANGRGKFRLCVALDGFFKGACASCQLSGRPNRCSIKKGDDDGKSPTSEASPRFTATYTLPPPPEAHYPNGPPPPKRRRTQQSRELADPEPKSEEERRPAIRDMTERHWATVNSPMPAPPPQIPSQMNIETPNSRYIPPPPPPERDRPVTERPISWAAVNQAPPLPPPPPPPSQPLNGRDEQNGSFSQQASYESERREGTAGNEEASISLIDSLPKSKQRQIYGVLGGLQSGIDHLQRELDSLKRTFGINDD
ncbi:hypothetical protein F5884DRAFT_426031 [Xylogone sp. PMI_703]|nr:hypothetical protein F5884DRAFT_426031 [Xylogone sp. PMI_703]